MLPLQSPDALRTLETLLLEWGLRPWSVALGTCVMVPVILLVWCWRNGSLLFAPGQDNPDGHGLISPINAYLPLTIPLNYAIFSFYGSQERELATLVHTGVLGSAAIEPLVILGRLSPFLAAFAYCVAIGLMIYVIRTAGTRGERFTNWLVNGGKLRPVGLYFYCLFFGLQLGLVFCWFVQDIALWVAIARALPVARLDVYNADEMLGLQPLSEITTWSFIVISLIALLVAIWLVGARVTLRRQSFVANPGHVTAALVAPLAAALVVTVPLVAPHWVMSEAKRQAERRVGSEISTLAGALEAAGARRDTPELMKNLSDRLAQHDLLYARVRAAKTWPVSSLIASAFPLGFLSPLFLPLLDDFGRKLLRRYRKWGRRQEEETSKSATTSS